MSETVKIKFVGPGSGRVVSRPYMGDIYFPAGEPVDVPVDLAVNLIGQGVFVECEECNGEDNPEATVADVAEESAALAETQNSKVKRDK